MKNKEKILMTACVTLAQILTPSMALATGAESNIFAVPVGSIGPEVYIKQIAPDEQKITMYYLDQDGRDRNQWLAGLNVVWPKEQTDDLTLDLTDTEPTWANTFFNGDAQTILVSGWGIDVEQQPGAISLLENESATLYFSVRLQSRVPELDQQYWVAKADYTECMRYYQPGVVCEGQIEEDLTVKYYPYLNGEPIEMTVETETNNEPEDDGAGVIEPKTVGPVLNISVPSLTGQKSEPVLLAGVGSAVVDSGSGGEVDDEGDEWNDETTDELDGAVALQLPVEEETEVPELGGDEKNFWPLVLGAFAVAGGTLMLWWWVILPFLKRKKDEEEASKTAE